MTDSEKLEIGLLTSLPLLKVGSSHKISNDLREARKSSRISRRCKPQMKPSLSSTSPKSHTSTRFLTAFSKVVSRPRSSALLSQNLTTYHRSPSNFTSQKTRHLQMPLLVMLRNTLIQFASQSLLAHIHSTHWMSSSIASIV